MRLRDASGRFDRFRARYLLLLVVAFALAASVVWHDSRSTVTFEARTKVPGALQVFHSATGAYAEGQSATIAIDSPTQQLRLDMPQGEASHLRIDPAGGQPVAICHLEVDGRRVTLLPGPANQALVRSRGECIEIEPLAGADDPYVVLATAGSPAGTSTRARSLLAALLAAIALTLAVLLLRRVDTGGGPLADRAERIHAALSGRAHWIALVTIVVMGSLLAHALPPNGVPDEISHLSKIAKVEGGALLGDSGQRPLVRIQDNYGPFWEIRGKAPFAAATLAATRDAPLACERAVQALPTAADAYAPHLYAISAATLKLACVSETSFGAYLVIARILNLLAGALLIAIGIRYAGHGKWALFAVALLPMTLAQVASLSADSLTLSLSFCFIGLVSGIASGNIAPSRLRFVLPALALLLAFAKPGSAWVLCSLLFCRAAYLREGRSFPAALASVVVVPWLLHVAWALHSSQGAQALAGVDPAQNLVLLRDQPLAIARLAVNTFFGDGAGAIYRSTIGLLGWLDVPMSKWAYVLAGGILGASLWVNADTAAIRPWMRVVAASAVLGSLALLSLPLFIYWTPPHASTILGLQGRYFLPTLAFALVWLAVRAPPVTRLVLLGMVMLAPVLAFDAVNHVDAYYYG